MFRIIVAPRAYADFFEIVDYIRQDNPTAAKQFGDGLLKHLALLAVFPHLGTIVNRNPNVRKALYTPIRIYYRVDEKRRQLEVIHFWHAARQKPLL